MLQVAEEQEYIGKLENLVCYTTQVEHKIYTSKILGKKFRFTRHKVTEFLDLTTGEIISSQKAKKLGVTEYDYEPLTWERNTILGEFRKEVLDFARFVLKFRNKRRGVSPNVQGVAVYYSKYTGKRADDIQRRIVPKLYGTLLANDTLLMPPFQRNDRSATAAEHIAENTIAEFTFFQLMVRKFQVIEEA